MRRLKMTVAWTGLLFLQCLPAWAGGETVSEIVVVADKTAVRVITRHSDWLLVVAENRRGWIPADAIAAD